MREEANFQISKSKTTAFLKQNQKLQEKIKREDEKESQ